MNIFEREKKYILQTYKRHPLYMTKSSGKYLWDNKGKKYLDFFSGLGVCNVGHCRKEVVSAIKEQSKKLMHTSNLYYTLPQVEFAQKLSEKSLKGKVFFSNSGAEANECAIKIARKYGKGRQWKILSFTNSFHGRTLATLAATGQKNFHEGFKPLPKGFFYAKFNDINDVKKKINKSFCGVIVEPVQGEGGIFSAQRKFIKELRAVCSKLNILLIFDEIQSGLGKTGTMFAYEHYGIKPDVMTLAKSLGGGLPIGATITSPKVSRIFSRGDHGSTFGGNPVACAAGISVLKLLTPALLRNVVSQGKYFISKLNQLKESHTIIKEVRGIGLMIGMELNKPGAEIVEKCQKKGLLVNCTQGNILRFLPPLDITKKDIDYAVKIMGSGLNY
ncbi:MAG: aspartate aminotransferase family protein [bacterium]